MTEPKDPAKTLASWPGVVATLEALPTPAAVSDGADGARVRVNRRFVELFHEAEPAEEMPRADYEALLLSCITPADRERATSLLQRLREDPRATGTATLHLGAAPESATVSVWSVPVEDGEGAVTGRLTLFREIGTRALGDVGGGEEPRERARRGPSRARECADRALAVGEDGEPRATSSPASPTRSTRRSARSIPTATSW